MEKSKNEDKPYKTEKGKTIFELIEVAKMMIEVAKRCSKWAQNKEKENEEKES